MGIAVGFKISSPGVKKSVTGDVKSIMVMKIIIIIIIIKNIINRIYLRKKWPVTK
jgi:hypothetical protein